MSDSDETVTAKEIEEWNEENDEPHPVFEVEHRPERISVSDEPTPIAAAVTDTDTSCDYGSCGSPPNFQVQCDTGECFYTCKSCAGKHGLDIDSLLERPIL